MSLSDQILRDRFTRETGKNFSVIAPAGVGKTRAIADRVVQLAREDQARFTAGQPVRLPQLVVATFTRKAADELRNRARRAIVDAHLEPRVLGWFNEAFFGTIHSFCLELIRRFGPLAGLPTTFSVERNDAALRLAFQRDTPDIATFLPEQARAAWRRYGSAEAVWDLVWNCPSPTPAPPPGRCPEVNIEALLAFQPSRKNKRAQKNIRRSLAQARRWRDAPAGERALGVPSPFGKSEEFVEEWIKTFHPLREWLAAAAAHAACGLAQRYAEFKERQGRLGYDDFVRLALRLLRDPQLSERIRAQEFSVLLDEAQDTDPAQFAVLVGVTQPVGAPGLWMEGAGEPPALGRFSMVGDPQQAIFERADVRAYIGLHDRLLATGAAEELKFSVTMRCDELIVEGVNAIFPNVLHGKNGQAKFVTLQARPGAGPGRIWRLLVARPAAFNDKSKVDERIRAEADALAQWLAAAGPAGVGAADWSEVAVLAPRRNWLSTLGVALGEAGLAGQMHSDGPGARTDPARAWLAALLGVLADPADEFERIGLGREIFGIPDDEIYRARTADMVSPRLAATMTLLTQLSFAAQDKPLREAVALAVEGAQLRERLHALGVASEDLDELLNQATLAEARGDTLAMFARALREGPAEVADLVARRGEIQLLTNHKAKGLEWSAVIWFGMFVEPKLPHSQYPCWLPLRVGEPPACVYDELHAQAVHAETAWRHVVAAENCARFERLLYVSATRPKQTLIAVDAAALGETKNSLADILGVLPGGRAHDWWSRVPIREAPPAPAKNISSSGQVKTEPAPWPQPPLSPRSFSVVKSRAEKFMRRVRPSTLSRHGAAAAERLEPDLAAPPEFPEEQLLPAAAVDYGNWWHGVMESTSWSAGPVAWQAHWEPACATAPDPERAKRETALLLKSLLANILNTPGLEFVAEMPFLWPEPGNARAFDGCMDLAVWDAAAKKWLVIDWKTDRVDGGAAELRARYGPQLEVYARALAAVYAAPVEAVIYSTRTGEPVVI